MLEICKYIQFKLNHRDIPMPPCIIFTLKVNPIRCFVFLKKFLSRNFKKHGFAIKATSNSSDMSSFCYCREIKKGKKLLSCHGKYFEEKLASYFVSFINLFVLLFCLFVFAFMFEILFHCLAVLKQ